MGQQVSKPRDAAAVTQSQLLLLEREELELEHNQLDIEHKLAEIKRKKLELEPKKLLDIAFEPVNAENRSPTLVIGTPFGSVTQQVLPTAEQNDAQPDTDHIGLTQSDKKKKYSLRQLVNQRSNMTEEQMDDITMTKNEAKVVRKLLDQCSSNTRRRRLDRTATGNVEKTSNNTNAWKAKMRLANRKARATSEKELNVKAKTESPRKALALSSEEYTFTTTNPNHKRIVLWTDGSGPIPSTGTAGSAVVYLTSQDNTMMTRSWHLTSCASNDVGELFAVCQALEIALSEVLEWSVKEPYPNTLLGPKLLEVVVYTDSTTALRAVESIQFIQDTIGNPILTKIKATIALLKDLAAMIEIRWIPGHQGDYGNCAADAASKRAARWDPTWDLATSDSSVVPVKIHGATFEVVSRDVVHLDTQPPVTG